MGSHMLNVLDPAYFKEFQGDLMPARMQQIEKARKEEEARRLEKKLEYETKMREQREKEEERQRRKREMEELRRRKKEKLMLEQDLAQDQDQLRSVN